MVAGLSSWFTSSAILPALQDLLSLDAETASLLAISVQIGFLIGAIGVSVSNVADTVADARWLIAGGSVLAAVSNVLLVASGALGIGGVLVVRAVTGVGLALVYPIIMKVISTWFQRRRGLALGAMVGALTVGSALPHLVRGIVFVAADCAATDNPAACSAQNWKSVVYATSGLTLAAGVIVLRFGALGPFAFARAVFSWSAVPDILTGPCFLPIAAYLGHMIELYAVWTWIGDFFARGANLDPATSSFLAFAAIGVGVVGAVGGGTLRIATLGRG
jgi:MFS family permease